MSAEVRCGLTAVFSAGFLGGSELFNLEFLRRAAERGVTVDAVVPAPGPLADALAPIVRRIALVPPPEELTTLSRFDAHIALGSLPGRVRALGRYVRRVGRVTAQLGGDVCALGFRSQLVMAFVTPGLDRRVSWVIHEVVPPGPFGTAWSLASRRVERAFAYSATAAEQPLLRTADVRLCRVRLPLDGFAAAPAPASPPRVLGLVGDLFALKNHLGAIEVIQRLRARGHDVRGLLVGRDVSASNPTSELTRRVRGAVAAGGGSIELTSVEPSAMPEVMARMDLLLHLSTVPESFGRVCAEAMAAGRPVVAFDHGAVPEVVRGAGVLCPPGDLKAVVEVVAGLRDDPSRFAQLSKRARDLALERFGGESGGTVGDELAQFATEARR